MLVGARAKRWWRLLLSMKPLHPTWIVDRVACVLILCTCSTRCRYLLSFLSFALKKLASQCLEGKTQEGEQTPAHTHLLYRCHVDGHATSQKGGEQGCSSPWFVFSLELVCNGVLRDLPGCGTISCKLHIELLHAVRGWVSAVQLHTCASSCFLLI